MKWLRIILLALPFGCGAGLRYGTVSYPNELLIGRQVEWVWPTDDGRFKAVSGDWWCPLEIAPLDVREGDVVMCRWVRG